MTAKTLHADETSYSVNGKLYWVWIILNPETGEAYCIVRPSRGANVLKELLPGWNGISVCDGWPPYNIFKKMQRCWAHITREAHHLNECNPNNANAKHLYKWLSDIYHDAKKKRPARDRQKDHDLLSCRIRRLMSKYAGDPLFKPFMNKLRNALPHLFTFVLNPRVPPTNNAAERGLREIVVHRKIRDTIKSRNTPNIMGNIFTCIMTWKVQGLDHLAEMAKYL